MSQIKDSYIDQVNEELISISGEPLIKKSTLIELYKKHIEQPIKNLLNKAEEDKKTKLYADTVLFNEKHEILLLLRKNDDDFMPGVWCLPGGSVEEGEDPLFAGQRELTEETGITTEILSIKSILVEGGEIFYHTGFVNSMLPILLNVDEHINYEWVDLAYLSDYELIQGLDANLDEILSLITVKEHDVEEPIISTYESVLKNFEILKAGFDQDLISEEKFIKALNYKNDFLKTTIEDVCDLEKSKAGTKEWKMVHRKTGKVFSQRFDVKKEEMNSNDRTPGDTGSSAGLKDSLVHGIKYKDKFYDKDGNEIKINPEYKAWANKSFGADGLNNLREGFVQGFDRLKQGKEIAREMISKIEQKQSIHQSEKEIFEELLAKRKAKKIKERNNPQTYVKEIDSRVERVKTLKITDANMLPALRAINNSFNESPSVMIETDKGNKTMKLNALIQALTEKGSRVKTDKFTEFKLTDNYKDFNIDKFNQDSHYVYDADLRVKAKRLAQKESSLKKALDAGDITDEEFLQEVTDIRKQF